jgi:hypothetical protein
MRFKKNITLNENKDVYQPGTYISFNLPKKKLDLHSLSLNYIANPANAEHIIAFLESSSLDFPTQTNTGTAAAPTMTSVVDDTRNTIEIQAHGYPSTGEIVRYSVDKDASGFKNPPIAPLVDGGIYIVAEEDVDNVTVYNYPTNNTTPVEITLQQTGVGTHTFTKLTRSYRTIRRFLPRLSSCIIDELIVKLDNKVVQHLREYNTLAAILNDIQKEYDDIDSTSSDSVQNLFLNASSGFVANNSKIQSVARNNMNTVTKYFNTSAKTYFIDKFLGFLGEGNRYFDATDKDIQIMIKLAPPNILYKGISGFPVYLTQTDAADNALAFAPDYELLSISASIDVLDDIPQMSDFVYKDYVYHEGMYLADNKRYTTRVSLEKPVEWVLGTFKRPDYKEDQELQLMHCNPLVSKFGAMIKDSLTLDDINTQTPNTLTFSYEISKIQKDPYILNSSVYFSHQGDAVKYCRYRYNNTDLTPQLDVISCYRETKKCFNTDFKRVQSIFQFESDFFANAVRVDDTSSTYKTIEWEVDIDSLKSNNKGGYPMLFVCTSGKL